MQFDLNETLRHSAVVKMVDFNLTLWEYAYDETFGAPIITVLLLHFILAFPANLFIVVHFFSNCRDTVKCNSHIFLFGLAPSDLLVTVLCVPLLIDTIVRKELIKGGSESHHTAVCEFQGFIYELSLSISLFILILLSTENFIATLKNTRYKCLIRPEVVSGLTVGAWVSILNEVKSLS